MEEDYDEGAGGAGAGKEIDAIEVAYQKSLATLRLTQTFFEYSRLPAGSPPAAALKAAILESIEKSRASVARGGRSPTCPLFVTLSRSLLRIPPRRQVLARFTTSRAQNSAGRYQPRFVPRWRPTMLQRSRGSTKKSLKPARIAATSKSVQRRRKRPCTSGSLARRRKRCKRTRNCRKRLCRRVGRRTS